MSARLPPGWVEAPAGNVLTFEYGKGLPARARRPGGVSVLSSAGAVDTHDEALASGEVLVVGRKGAAGKVTLARGDVWVIDTAYYAVVPQSLNPRFLELQLQAAELWRLDQSTAIPSLSREDLNRVPLRLPPRSEQDRIAASADALTGVVAEGESRFHAALRGIEELRLTRLAELAPAGVSYSRLRDLSEIFVGSTPSRTDPSLWGGDIPWVSSGEVSFCRITATNESITDLGLGNADRRLHPPGTLLLAMIGEGKTRGQAAILDVAASHNQNSAAIRLDRERMLPEYLYYWLMREYRATRATGTGSQQPALNKNRVGSLMVPVPELHIQRALVADLERDFNELEAGRAVLTNALDDSALLRRAIIARAMKGELAADEPRLPSRVHGTPEPPATTAS